jgi:hypothetical protein
MEDVGVDPDGFAGMAGFAGWAAFGADFECLRFGLKPLDKPVEEQGEQIEIAHCFWPPGRQANWGQTPLHFCWRLAMRYCVWGQSPIVWLLAKLATSFHLALAQWCRGNRLGMF